MLFTFFLILVFIKFFYFYTYLGIVGFEPTAEVPPAIVFKTIILNHSNKFPFTKLYNTKQ